MRTIAALALAAAAATAGISQAQTDNRLAMLDNLPMAFDNQKQCLQGLHILRHAAVAADTLPAATWALVDKEDIDVRVDNRYALFTAMYHMYNADSISMEQYGWETTDFSFYMDMIRNIAEDYKSDQPEILTDLTGGLMEKCYVSFREFEFDDEVEFEIIDEVGLPQDTSWNGFTFKLADGKRYILNDDGTVKKQM